MRPKLLEIEGLQSFTSVQKIDFEKLGETGLFGIFGPTGSGKSTILDAITFALYGKVKRAEGGTQGIINSGMNTVRVSYTFELQREGKRKTYRVERTYQRKKNSPNSCEAKIARLIEVTGTDEIPLCDKATEVTNYIKELLGLSNEDFTRAVVLPQNSFQEFLMLNNSERRSMLERVFYLEEYGKQLWEKLGRLMARLKTKLDILSGELKGYSDASEEAMSEAKQEMEAAVTEKSRVEKEFKLLEARFNEAKEVWSLVCELNDFTRKEEQLMASKDMFDEKKTCLEKALKADGLMEMISRARALEDKVSSTEKQLGELMSVLPGIIEELEKSKALYDDIKSRATSEKPALVERRTRLSDAAVIRDEVNSIEDKIRGLQDTLSQVKKAIDEKNEKLEKEISLFNELGLNIENLKRETEPLKADPEYRKYVQKGVEKENEIAVLGTKVKTLRERKITLVKSVEELEQKLNAVGQEICSVRKAMDELALEKQKHDSSKPGDRNVIVKSLDRIHSVKSMCEILKIKENELNELKTKMQIQEAGLRKMEQTSTEKAESLKKAGETYEQCKHELEAANREISKNAAYMLSKNLVDGQPCPVCGSTSHPSPASEHGESALAVLEEKAAAAAQKLSDAESALKLAEKEALIASEQLKAARMQKNQAEQEMAKKKAELEENRQKLPEKLRFLELEQVYIEVEKANRTYDEKLAAIDTWELKQKEYEERLKKINDELAGHLLVERGINAELQVNRENMGQLAQELSSVDLLLSEATQELKAYLQKYGINSASAELDRLAENDRKLYLLQKEIDIKQEQYDSKRALLDRLREEQRLLNADRIKLEAETESLAARLLERRTRLTELAGDLNIEEEIAKIDWRIEEFNRLENEYRQKLEEYEKQHRELQIKKSLLENQLEIFSENLKKDVEALKTAMQEKGFTDLRDIEASVLPQEKQKELKAEIDNYSQAVSNIRAQIGLLQSKLKSRYITEDEWMKINAEFTHMSAYKEECVSQSEVARNRYENLSKKHEKWVELKKKYDELSHKQGLYEQIQKLLRAEHRKDNSFIDYIAEERLRYVAAKASEILGVMTKYRYMLELDAESGFIIKDNGNGGVHRMVTSLSGGETFLTSLSLALALSEQIQLKGQSPLEFFFLDEGFGTLDHELLDTVIDSLERLCNKDRVIGLISHVPELKERIARRLIVEPPALKGEGSRVKVEKA